MKYAKHAKKVLCILFAVMITVAMFSGTASLGIGQAAENSDVAGTIAYGKTFSIKQPVTVDWNELAPYGKTFKTELYDMKTKKIVSRTTLKSTSTVYDASIFKSSTTYRVTISALNVKGKSVKTVTDYFHIGKAVVNPPKSPKEKLTIVGVESVVTEPQAELTAAPEQAASQLPSGFADAANAIKADNSYFASTNANSDKKLWFNKPLNTQYDAYIANVLKNSYSASHFRYDYSFEAILFNMVNQYRVEMGRKPLVWSDNLAKLARLRVTAGCDAQMTHDIAEVGGMPLPTAVNCGWTQKTVFGENIVGKASSTKQDWARRAGELLTLWKNSPGHNANMLEEDYKYGGMAIVTGDNAFGRNMTGAWALQLFAG